MLNRTVEEEIKFTAIALSGKSELHQDVNEHQQAVGAESSF